MKAMEINLPNAQSQQNTLAIWQEYRTKSILSRLRYDRMGAKRRLLLKLSIYRKNNYRARLDEAETKLFLSLLPRWKRWMVYVMWAGMAYGNV